MSTSEGPKRPRSGVRAAPKDRTSGSSVLDAGTLGVKAPETSRPDPTTGAFQSDGTIGHSDFPPIVDYAFLSDCEANCLIAPSGCVEWMCLPWPDSPSVFGALLDRGAGHFWLAPFGESVPAARRYIPGA